MSNVDSGTSVTRSGLNADGGYTWSIQFAESMGNVPELTVIPADTLSVSRSARDFESGYTWTVTFLEVSLPPSPPYRHTRTHTHTPLTSTFLSTTGSP